MPRSGVALFVRPLFDRATTYGNYYMGQAMGYASRRMSVRDLNAGDATRTNILASIEADDPAFCYLLGHGNADTYTAQNQEVVMVTCHGDEVLIGRVVLLLSCSCGIRIAPSAVSKGAAAVHAWAVDFTWVGISVPDEYSRGFFESVNAISNALSEGRTAGEAMNRSMSAWSQWIEYWMGSDDPYASVVIQYMIHDRDGQRLFGSAAARVVAPGPPVPEPGMIPLPFPFLTGHALIMLSLLAA